MTTQTRIASYGEGVTLVPVPHPSPPSDHTCNVLELRVKVTLMGPLSGWGRIVSGGPASRGGHVSGPMGPISAEVHHGAA